MKTSSIIITAIAFTLSAAMSITSAHAENSSLEDATPEAYPAASIAGEESAPANRQIRLNPMPGDCIGWNSGYLCAANRGAPYRYVNLKGSNADWSTFGWDNCADDFYNGGKTSTAVVYAKKNYKGDSISVPKNTYLMGWFDVASSNTWK
ncbi:MAG: hypothetical protein LBR21_11035 [Propionibacteriaceae bacterium]|jgi:hypothetical protein|nr:hypothetical protein [Propionibacteriaceae bacterium]